MTWLLADIGGTNTRLALASPDGPLASRHIRNDLHASFDALLDAEMPPGTRIEAACIATAGPVTGDQARLTNRNWTIDRAALGTRLGTDRIRLINDLGALAASVAALPPEGLEPLTDARPDPARQLVVIGFGTGVNICGVQPDSRHAPLLWAAEYGHSALPAPVAALLGKDTPETVEELFAGRGVARFFGLSRGEDAVNADPARQRLWAQAAGLTIRELAWQFLPTGGICVAGSVARGLLTGDNRAAFLDAATPQMRNGVTLPPVPIAMIRDDAAGLIGCREMLKGLA